MNELKMAEAIRRKDKEIPIVITTAYTQNVKTDNSHE